MSINHLNQRQLAQRWGLSEASLEGWRTKGIGPVFLKLQGRVLYRLEDIESYEVQCLRKSTSERAGEGHGSSTEASTGQ
ncbi:MAG: DNA-binding protein [Ralstonia pickettii]|nr:DNA-binding protein [Ralstonia pickettii]